MLHHMGCAVQLTLGQLQSLLCSEFFFCFLFARVESLTTFWRAAVCVVSAESWGGLKELWKAVAKVVALLLLPAPSIDSFQFLQSLKSCQERDLRYWTKIMRRRRWGNCSLHDPVLALGARRGSP